MYVVFQAIPDFVDSAAQTDWKYPRNAGVQYEPRLFEEEERKKMENSPELLESANHVVPRWVADSHVIELSGRIKDKF